VRSLCTRVQRATVPGVDGLVATRAQHAREHSSALDLVVAGFVWVQRRHLVRLELRHALGGISRRP
jgi:hypothetical protein